MTIGTSDGQQYEDVFAHLEAVTKAQSTEVLTTKDNPPPLPTHSEDKPLTTTEKLGLAATAKIGESVGYAGLAAVPAVLDLMNAGWVASWLSMGHALRSDVRRQVNEGKKLNEMDFSSNSILKFLSDLQQKSSVKPTTEVADAQKAEVGIDPNLSMEDQRATIEAQRFPSNAFKVNPKAFNDWLEAGPWEGNIEDRRFMLKEHTGDIKALVDRMNKTMNRKSDVGVPQQILKTTITSGDKNPIEVGGGGVYPKGGYENVKELRRPANVNKEPELMTPEMERRYEELRARLLPSSGRPLPVDVIEASKKLDHLGWDYPGQAVRAIRQDYKLGGVDRVKSNWDIQPKDELDLQKILNYIKANPLVPRK